MRGPFYPDEVRNVYIAKSITTPREFLIPHHLDEVYWSKPPLYFWFLKSLLAIPSFSFLLMPILFNTIVSWAILCLNYLFFKEEGEPAIGTLSSLLLFTTAVFYGMSVVVRMDTLFLFFILLSVYSLWFSIKKQKESLLLVSACASFCAVFTKGAFGFIFPFFIGLGMALFSKNRNVLRKVVLANVLVLLLIAIWISSFTHLNSEYFDKMLFEQTIDRSLDPKNHAQPIFYYFPFLFLLFLPWSLVGAGYFLYFKKNKIAPWEKLFLLWLIGGFLILSLVGSKVPIYLLLLVPAFCGLTAKFLIQGPAALKKKLFYFTGGFFLFCWIGGFVYSRLNEIAVPASAYFILILFVLAVILMVKRGPAQQWRNTFLIWAIIMQMGNFLYLPLASKASRYNKIVAALKETHVIYEEIYVDERPLLQLNIYPLKQPVVRLEERKEICQKERAILVSKSDAFSCTLDKIATIDDFFLWYKEK
ncbi:MAG: glycosyltransferase family 39 protein [Candidatus Omnitrophota bacterium]|nr:MAG: glycosyltransferase family 39 protein [Candidatus Omnitrophota bacterium]